MTVEWIWGKPLIEGFSNKPQKGYVEVAPDAGMPFRRLQFTDISDLASCTFSLTKPDYVKFMSWYRYNLRQGTLPFEIWDCRYKRKRLARLIDDVPNYVTNSNRYTLSLTIAFQPEIIFEDFELIVNDNDRLIVNDADVLIAGVALRI